MQLAFTWLLVAALSQAVHPQLFAGKITSFLDFLRPRRVPAHRNFLNPKHKHRRAQNPRPVRKAARPSYPQNKENSFAQAPVLKHYVPLSHPKLSKIPKITLTTPVVPLITNPPSTTPFPIILITSSPSSLIQPNPSSTDWQPLSGDEYPTLFEEVTPVKIKKNLEELSTDKNQDEVGMVSKFSLFPRPYEESEDNDDDFIIEAFNEDQTVSHALGSIQVPVSDLTLFKENDNIMTQYSVGIVNDKNDSTAHVMDVNGDDLGPKDMSIKGYVYHPTSEQHEYSNNPTVNEAISDEMHKPYFVPVRDYPDTVNIAGHDIFDKAEYIAQSDGKYEDVDEGMENIEQFENASDKTANYMENADIDTTEASEDHMNDYEYEQIYAEYSSSVEPNNNVIREVDNNHIDTVDTLEPKVTKTADDTTEDYYEPPTDNSETLRENSYAKPQYKSELPNSSFQSEFFNPENIENIVFSIPAQFRTFLQEPPGWINKDYW